MLKVFDSINEGFWFKVEKYVKYLEFCRINQTGDRIMFFEKQEKKEPQEHATLNVNKDNDKEKKLKDLLQESKQVFLNEQKEAFTRALFDLLDYSLQPSKETAERLERFFHTLHGSAATLEVTSLAELAAEYEEYIDKTKESKDLSEKILVKLLKGLALTHRSLEQLHGQNPMAQGIAEGAKQAKEDIQKEDYKATILLIGSDNALNEQLEKSFFEQGYSLFVGNFQVTKSTMKEEKIDLVLLDVRKSQNDVMEHIAKVHEEQGEVPILFIAPHSVPEDKIKALKAGVEDYIPEPFTIEQLITRINLALKGCHLPNVPYVDSLTDTYTIEYLEKQLKVRASQEQGYASLTLIDLSWIKEINESLGYSSGDVVLKEFIRKLQDKLEENNEVYRLTGLEFAILLPDQNTEQTAEKLQKIKSDIGTMKFRHRGTDIPLRPSFTSGIVMFAYEDNFPLTSILERARQALNLARSTGQEIVVYNDSLRRKKKILLVEDTDFIVYYVQGKLQTMNIEVHNAKDGEEGVRKAQIERPDLMIIDLMLPKMDGFEVCRQIKANPKTRDIKIIIMSARKSKEDVLRCFNLGIDDYIVKPFALEDLEQRIKRLL
ncbi:hypothetical protein JCM15765_13910 [Paradesulfitobacterium aromaticivorans]